MNEDLLELTLKLSKQDLQYKNSHAVMLSLMEEIGELAREMKVEDRVFGNIHKAPGEENSLAEGVDVVICSLALYFMRYMERHGDSQGAIALLETIMEKKLRKWDRVQKDGLTQEAIFAKLES